MTIQVLNGYQTGWQNGHYIGRQNKDRKGSALYNPFKLRNAQDDIKRAEVVANYRKYLWSQIQMGDSRIMGELQQLKAIAQSGELNLLCYCAPRQCHGDVVKACIEWMIEQEKEVG